MTPVYSQALQNEFVDIDQTLIFNYKLPGGKTVNGLSQPISADGDYFLCGLQVVCAIFENPLVQTIQGEVGVRLADDSGYKLMNEYVTSLFMTPAAGNSYPFIIRPQHKFLAGTRINIDLQEMSNLSDESGTSLPNLVQIAFRGFYRYRTASLLKQQQLRKGL